MTSHAAICVFINCWTRKLLFGEGVQYYAHIVIRQVMTYDVICCDELGDIGYSVTFKLLGVYKFNSSFSFCEWLSQIGRWTVVSVTIIHTIATSLISRLLRAVIVSTSLMIRHYSLIVLWTCGSVHHRSSESFAQHLCRYFETRTRTPTNATAVVIGIGACVRNWSVSASDIFNVNNSVEALFANM